MRLDTWMKVRCPESMEVSGARHTRFDMMTFRPWGVEESFRREEKAKPPATWIHRGSSSLAEIDEDLGPSKIEDPTEMWVSLIGAYFQRLDRLNVKKL